MKLNFKNAFNVLMGKKGYIDTIIHAINYGQENNIYTDINKVNALEYYSKVSCVNNAINLIADGVSNLNPVLWDRNEQKFIKQDSEDNSEIQDSLFALLEKPNLDTTQGFFFKQLLVYYLATGNTYVLATGDIEKQPLELLVIPSQHIKASCNDKKLIKYEIIYNGSSSAVFLPTKTSKGNLVYSTADKMAQLYHIKTFNPFADKNTLEGMSLLNPIHSEIKQIMASNRHNFSMLENGAILGGILGVDNLSTDQENKLRRDFEQKYQGSRNSYKIALLNKSAINFTELGKTMKDMDFRNLLIDNEKKIYLNLKIPLPLVSQEASTFNNFKEATYKLYDNAILPTADYIYDEITKLLMPRFGIEEQVITYDEDEIKALQDRRIKSFLDLSNANKHTVNELRSIVGKESLSGGDAIYQNIGLVPMLYDENTTDNLSKPQPRKKLESTPKHKFIELMKKQVDDKGNRKFSDTEIKEIAEKNGLK